MDDEQLNEDFSFTEDEVVETQSADQVNEDSPAEEQTDADEDQTEVQADSVDETDVLDGDQVDDETQEASSGGHNINKGLQQLQQKMGNYERGLEELKSLILAGQQEQQKPVQPEHQTATQQTNPLDEILATKDDERDVFKDIPVVARQVKSLEDQIEQLKQKATPEDTSDIRETLSQIKARQAFNEAYPDVAEEYTAIEQEARKRFYETVGGEQYAVALHPDVWQRLSGESISKVVDEWRKNKQPAKEIQPASDQPPKAPRGAKIVPKGAAVKQERPEKDESEDDLISQLTIKS